MNKNKILILTPLRFYSHEDEELFFHWLEKIPTVKRVKGIGKELHVTLSKDPITFNEYRNFLGIFKRYKIKSPEQLKILFGTEENQDWFHDK